MNNKQLYFVSRKTTNTKGGTEVASCHTNINDLMLRLQYTTDSGIFICHHSSPDNANNLYGQHVKFSIFLEELIQTKGEKLDFVIHNRLFYCKGKKLLQEDTILLYAASKPSNVEFSTHF